MMKRTINMGTGMWFCRIAVLTGYISFLLHVDIRQPLMSVAAAALLLVTGVNLKYKKNYICLLLPYSSGLLCFLLKQFYWDKFDFVSRLNGLLLLALLFTIVLTIREFALLKKFLFFFNGLGLKKRVLVIFIFTESLFILSAGILVKKGVVLGGDEPHYLAISQSLIKDLDLNVFNQYFREGYKEFIDVKKLPAHAAFGKGYKKMYSIHLPGVSFTVAPFLLLNMPLPGLYFLIRAYLGIFGALLAVVVYLFSLKLWQEKNLSLFICFVFCLTVPVFSHSFHIFPELQVLLLILSALYFLFFPGRGKNLKTLFAGLLLGITVFWGLKYMIFIYLFSSGFFFYFFVKLKERKRAFLFILFPFLFQLLFFYYLFFAYGNFSPMSVYTGMMSETQAEEYYSKAAAIPLRNRIETLLNYLFDQRDGLLLYNPFYFFAFPGLLIALRKFKTYLPHLLVSAAGFIYILYHGYSTVRPGYCPQARYLVPVMWLFMLFAVIYYREIITGNEPNQNLMQKPGYLPRHKGEKVFFLLPVYSVFVVIYQVFHPFTMYQPTTHDNLFRPGLLFQQWSNQNINIPSLLPSFIKVQGNFAYLPNLIFLVLFALPVILALRPAYRNRSPETVSKTGSKGGIKKNGCFCIPAFVFLFAVFILFPRVPLYNAVLVKKEGAIPYRIYGESRQPGSTTEKILQISGKDSARYTISTAGEVRCIMLELSNKKKGTVNIDIYNYDKRAGEVTLQPQQTRRMMIKSPRFKVIKNLFFYQLTLSFRPRDSHPVSLEMQLSPLKKPGN